MAILKTMNSNGNSTVTMGFERKLWSAANSLRKGKRWKNGVLPTGNGNANIAWRQWR